MIKQLKAIVEKVEGKLVAVASTETKDRVGDVVKADGWTLSDFKKNPVLLFAHKYDQPPIGVARNIKVQDKKLIFEPVFHDITQLAREVKAMFLAEPPIMKAFSVGFQPLEFDEKDSHQILRQELLEISAVPVPANAEALTVASKSYKPEQKKEIDGWVKEQCEEGVCKTVIEKPYPNFHSCRLRSPGKFKPGSFRTMSRTHDGKKYSVIMGRLKGETTLTEQGYRYPKEVWTTSSARSHCKGHDGILFEPATGKAEEKQTYTCECLDCGHVFETDEHCRETECPKCGGETRRVERPGPGKEAGKGEVKEKEEKKPIKKERWNKSFSKIFDREFDIESVESVPDTFEIDMFTKFLDCQVKNIYCNNHLIPFPLMGTYLFTMKEILNDFDKVDTRNFTYSGKEIPPVYETLKLTSQKSDDFLVEGVEFYKVMGNNSLVIKVSPNWFGITVSLVTKDLKRNWNKSLMEKIHKLSKENNLLRGEKFALNGEFLEKTDDTFENLVLEEKDKNIIMKGINFLKKNKEKAMSRGMMFIGRPGTGKTKTGRVIMNELDTTFIWVSSKDFGRVSPVRALSLSFNLARDLAPTVLFIEDIDTWLGSYTIDLLKTELDGIKQNKGIVTILTSNTPEKLPDALLDRPGRFHDIIDFKLPKKEQRKEMIKLWITDRNIDEKILDKVVNDTEGMSGAHIKELVNFAEIIEEEEKISISEAIIISLDKMKEQKELIKRIKREKEKIKEIITDSVNLKEGRIISGKNRKIINDAMTSMKIAIFALKDLLKATIPSISEEEKSHTNGREKVVHKPRKNRVRVRALQSIAKQLNNLLKYEKRN